MKTAKGLPEFCYAIEMTNGKTIQIIRGENGFRTVKPGISVNDANAALGVTAPQVEAMVAGSMFGWSVPAADPAAYDEGGKIK